MLDVIEFCHIYSLEIFTFSQFYEKKNGHSRKRNPKYINIIESILVWGNLKWNGDILESARTVCSVLLLFQQAVYIPSDEGI